MSNIVCLKHRKYTGEGSPDLSCKACCSMYVARIRRDQADLLESVTSAPSDSFKPLSNSAKKAPESQSMPKFDSSWL